MRSKVLRMVAVLGVLLLGTVWLFGQAETGVVTGTVTDTSNAVVPGATVTVVSAATALTRSTTTASAGEYAITNLPPATYTLTIEHSGFQKFSRQVQVLVGSRNEISATGNFRKFSKRITLHILFCNAYQHHICYGTLLPNGKVCASIQSCSRYG